MQRHCSQIFLFFAFITISKAQMVSDNYPLLSAHDSLKQIIIFSNDNFYNSNAVNNHFISFFTNGGFIDSLSKAAVNDKLKKNNVIGSEISIRSVFYLHNSISLGKANWGYFFNAGYFEYHSASFNDNLFNLVFWGNKQFAGKQINLSGCNFTNISAQKLGAGIYNKNSFSSFGLNFYNINSFRNYNVNRANFFTEENGQYITLDINQQIVLSDTNNRKFFANNGWGMGTDIVINLNTGKNRSATIDDAFSIRIENLGFGILQGNTLHHRADTTINYSGFEVNNIINTDNNLTPISLTDTLKLNYRQGTKNFLLPFTVTIGKIPSRYSSNKVESFYGIRYRYASNYKPLFYAGIFARLNKKFNASANLQAGGYGNFNVALQLDYRPLQNFWITIGCSNLGGTLFKNLNGKAINANVYVAF